jgi:hypothetical protein
LSIVFILTFLEELGDYSEVRSAARGSLPTGLKSGILTGRISGKSSAASTALRLECDQQ